MIEIRWVASVSASAFHALDRLARGLPVADVRLAEPLSPIVEKLRFLLRGKVSLPAELLAHVIPMAATIGSNRDLVEVSLRKTLGPPIDGHLLARLTEVFTEVENIAQRTLPGLVDELALRTEPLREQWEARGPGLMATVARWTEPDVVVGNADVILIHPVAGGAGVAHVPYNSVRIEAMLANPHAELPEVARLAWLLAQLNSDLPKYQGELTRARVARAAALGLIPLVLKSAAEVELAAEGRDAVFKAIATWEVSALFADGPPDASLSTDPQRIGEIVWQWFETYRELRPAWDPALTALDQMLQAAAQ